LSAGYLNSPELHLVIAESRWHLWLTLSASFVMVASVLLLVLRGYEFSLLLAPFIVWLLIGLHRDTLAGGTLCWRQGQWTLRRRSETMSVKLLPVSLALPGCIYLVWYALPRGPKRRAWLFADSASPEQLRRFRARLRLQR